jgi:hypothetical protein
LLKKSMVGKFSPQRVDAENQEPNVAELQRQIKGFLTRATRFLAGVIRFVTPRL